MGLPGAGKTTLADELAPLINAKRIDEEVVIISDKDWVDCAEGWKSQA